jgi:hypothetical protein
MWSQSTERPDAEETHESGETERLSRPKQTLSAVARRGRNGTAASLAGGILLAAALRAVRRDRRRAVAVALGGVALLGVALRQRRSEAETSSAGDEAPERDGTESTGEDAAERTESAEARSHLERTDVLHQSETNPRGVSGEPDVGTVTEPDEGNVRFSTEQEVENAEPKPHLDDETEDPRLNDGDDLETGDDHVDINLSEAAMADEASEAAGPTDEQSYPAREGTDPEPTSEKAPQRYGQGTVANTDEDTEHRQAAEETGEDERESRETEDESADDGEIS